MRFICIPAGVDSLAPDTAVAHRDRGRDGQKEGPVEAEGAAHEQHGRVHEQLAAQALESAVGSDARESHQHVETRYAQPVELDEAVVGAVEAELVADVAALYARHHAFKVIH